MTEMVKNNKISLRQLMVLFLMATISPAMRLIPTFGSQMGKQALWIGIIVAVLGFVALLFILQSLFKKHSGLNLSDLCFAILGRPLGSLLVALYWIWITLLLGLYLRYAVERLNVTILPTAAPEFLMGTILLLCFLNARRGIASFARLGEFLFHIVLAAFLLVSILALFNVKLTNLLPIRNHLLPAMGSSYVALGIWGYLLFLFFFADQVKDTDRIRQLGSRTAMMLGIAGVLIALVTVGALGYALTGKIAEPFYVVVKNISILEPLERMETLVLCMWLVTDFIIISLFTYITSSITKSLFSLTEKKAFVSPVILMTFSLSTLIAKNLFELEQFSEKIALPVNIILCFIIPIVMLVIGKLRRVI